MKLYRLFMPLLSLAAGCNGFVSSSPDDALESDVLQAGTSWDAFRAATYQEPESGFFIVDGDVPIEDEKGLREFYERYVKEGQLIVHRNGSADAKWDDARKLQLTYCVSTRFGTRHAAVVQAMAEATGAWEAAANVNFVHVSAQDGSCTSTNTQVLFDVRPVSGTEYLARAFFPGSSRSGRNILIDSNTFSQPPPLTLKGVLRHELGHTLGFRHEHTRPEAGTCFEDNTWRALTPYDSSSVMHYPQCNGTGSWTLELTALDKSGATALYGAAGTPPPSPPATSPVTEKVSGTVAAGENRAHGPYAVAAGTLFQVTMTGTGDPDLYVRFGAAPTTTTYACRPYTSGASEECRLTVPAGQSAAYVMVRGYSAGTYTLAVSYTKPATATPAPTPAPEPAPSPSTAFEEQVLTLVNQRRAAGATCGQTAYPAAPALVMNAQLREAARLHSQDMAAQNYMSHTSPDGRTFSQRIREAGYTGTSIAENIAAGYSTPEAVVAGWMGSAGHCVNIMNAGFRSIGVGYGFNEAASYDHYWTQTFGNQ